MFGIRSLLGRIKIGFALTRDSVGVLRNHPELAVLPLVSGIATIGYLVALFAPVLVFDATVGLSAVGDTGLFVLLFAWYFGTAFIAAFFNGALVDATGDVFAGKEPSVRRSLRAAAGELRLLLAWAAASATVGLLLRALDSSDSIVADLVRVVVSVGWTVTTFFVIPVIMFEDTSIRGTFGQSAETFRETWGETLGVSVGVTLTVFAATAVALVVAVGGALALGLGTVAVLVALAVFVMAYLAYATIWGIVKTALYGYAKEGLTPSEFDDVDFSRLESESATEGRNVR